MTTAFTVNFQSANRCLLEMLSAIGFMCLLGALAHCGTGCNLTPPQSAAELEAAYTAEITLCASTAKTKADSKLCRQGVDRKYHLCDAAWPAVTPCDQ